MYSTGVVGAGWVCVVPILLLLLLIMIVVIMTIIQIMTIMIMIAMMIVIMIIMVPGLRAALPRAGAGSNRLRCTI